MFFEFFFSYVFYQYHLNAGVVFIHIPGPLPHSSYQYDTTYSGSCLEILSKTMVWTIFPSLVDFGRQQRVTVGQSETSLALNFPF